VIPNPLPAPKDLWIEFWNMSLLTQKLQGGLDRINLSTATPGRVAAFLDSIRGGLQLDQKTRDRVLASLLSYRNAHPETESVEELADGWANAQKVDQDLIRKIANKLFVSRYCFEHRCLSKRAVK
jgi:hypothetical protein